MKNVFLTDVLNQPKDMRRALRFYADFDDVLGAIRALSPRSVLFTGMGSSHYCAQSTVIRLIQGGIPSRMESAGEILYYEDRSLLGAALTVLISQSGESGEIVDLLKQIPADRRKNEDKLP